MFLLPFFCFILKFVASYNLVSNFDFVLVILKFCFGISLVTGLWY